MTEPQPAPCQQGDLLLRGVVGSTAYGLNHADSDRDYLGVYVAPTLEVLGLRSHAAVTASKVTQSPDQTLHEVGKFTNLALAANPTVSELLWLDEYETFSPDAQLLVGARTAFLSHPKVLAAYGGYATRQARKLAARSTQGKQGASAGSAGRVAKHGRHCLRLVRQAQHLLETGQLRINVAELRDELFEAGRLAESDPSAFAALFEREMAALEQSETVLPEHPDVDTVNDLLVTLRRRHLS